MKYVYLNYEFASYFPFQNNNKRPMLKLFYNFSNNEVCFYSKVKIIKYQSLVIYSTVDVTNVTKYYSPIPFQTNFQLHMNIHMLITFNIYTLYCIICTQNNSFIYYEYTRCLLYTVNHQPYVLKYK